jgi:hypothetical protein
VVTDFAIAKGRQDVLIFKGWDVDESELDSALELEPMRMGGCASPLTRWFA